MHRVLAICSASPRTVSRYASTFFFTTFRLALEPPEITSGEGAHTVDHRHQSIGTIPFERPTAVAQEHAQEVFDRPLPHRLGYQSAFGPLAQLGERLVRNQEVGGSSPPRSTNLEN